MDYMIKEMGMHGKFKSIYCITQRAKININMNRVYAALDEDNLTTVKNIVCFTYS